MSKYYCMVCGNNMFSAEIVAKEMILGLREKFIYQICLSCESIQIKNKITNLGKFYDNSTYSSFKKTKHNLVNSLLVKYRNRYAYTDKGSILGALLNKLRPLDKAHQLIGVYAVNYSAEILDVGCGQGQLLESLAISGFKRLHGIDPFLEHDLVNNNFLIQKKYLHELTDTYDLIRLHHSFEHMSDPLETLLKIKCLLKPGGVCLITIPIVGSVFHEYGENSYILQAPQHLFLFSIKGIQCLAETANLPLEAVYRDATGISTWLQISSLWARDISCNEIINDLESYFSNPEKMQFRQKERELKENCLGDNVTFVFRKIY